MESKLFTCLACQIAFESAEGQRLHYRSEWHRYNLKRKVADLPPVTSEQFQQKAQVQKRAEATQTEQEQQPYKGQCAVCRKTFGTKNAYDNHIRSKKHKDAVAKDAARPKPSKAPKEKENVAPRSECPVSPEPQQQPKKAVDMTITDETPESEILAKIDEKISASKRLEETDCLFCSHRAETFEENMNHMTIAHSFFIPDIEYLVDIKGLIKYLGEKISIGNVCLYCNGRGRELRSLEAVRAHMIDKGHCKIAYEADEDALELVDYYDFSSSYAQLEEEGIDVDDEDLSSLTQRIRLADDNMSLILPNGNVVGHRSLKRYYDQSFKPEETRESVLINKLIGQYSEMEQFQSMRSNRSGNRMLITDGRGSKPTRSTEAFKDVRIHQDYQTRVGLQSNKLQKYFRVQII
ncbi:hypothetical protein VTP01DRAFT_1691 [Rhizomucor pusillus]|uniref:uncharacterized protein n=1 Tax=Rhizomucor pusillus TaxID=4840 RepID=UPI0037442CF7